jgi:hypothetical protein
MNSGMMRLYKQRYRLRKDCIARPTLCKFINWTTDAESLPHVGGWQFSHSA